MLVISLAISGVTSLFSCSTVNDMVEYDIYKAFQKPIREFEAEATGFRLSPEEVFWQVVVVLDKVKEYQEDALIDIRGLWDDIYVDYRDLSDDEDGLDLFTAITVFCVQTCLVMLNAPLYRTMTSIIGEQGVKAQVVSVPSIGLFLDQDSDYCDSVIPADVPTFGLTSGLPSTLRRVLPTGPIYGLDHFGASAPYKVLDEKFGFTPDSVAACIMAILQ